MNKRISALLLSSILCLGLCATASADDGGHWDFSSPDMGPQWVSDEITDVPGTPSTSIPDTPGTSTPDTPGTSTPDTPGTSAPDTPGTGTPSTPGASTPGSSGSHSANCIPAAPASPGFPVSTSTSGQGITITIATPTASVQNGKAAVTIETSLGNEIVEQAVSNRSKSVVIAPVMAGSAAQAEVSIPAFITEQIGDRTTASLTVSTPVAGVIIPNGGLRILSSAGGTVTVALKRTGHIMDLSITANGTNAGRIPGGITLTVPMTNAAPGTVAVLVHEDGSRETVRKSVVRSGSAIIPLDGSAKLEIVDSSRYFTDVPSTGWMADAVAFVSSRELFNGTAPNQFSPGLPMSRGMLTAALHNLESNPAQASIETFVDVDSGSWYAEGVAWAAASGIVGGYGGGRFGPSDSVTREQLAVMLWRHAGLPAPRSLSLNFIDADQASEWAVAALCWAADRGIIQGRGNGILDPGGYVTRAEAAQMLKGYMEQ